MPKTPTRDDLATMHLAGPAQNELIQREIDNNRSALSGRSMFIGDPEIGQQDMRQWAGFQSPDPAILRDAIRRDEETLAKGRPPEYSGYQKNQIYQLVKQAEERILGGMPYQEQMQQGTHGNVEHFIQHQEYTQVDQQVYLNGMRILYPAMEGLSIESLRPYQGGVKSRKPWEQGFERITWTAQEELEDTLATLDDSIYLRFMELYAQGIKTPRLLQQALGVSAKVYEACKARLAQATPSAAAPGVPEEPEEPVFVEPVDPEEEEAMAVPPEVPAIAAESFVPPEGLSQVALQVRRVLDKNMDLTPYDLTRRSYASKAKVAAALEELRQAADPIILRWDAHHRPQQPHRAAS